MSNIIKKDSEIELIKKSCQILAEVKKIVYDAAKEGVSLLELDKLAYQETIKRNAEPAFLGYLNFPNTICTALNEEVIHGIPDNRILKNGDLISIDMGVKYQGYYSDSAFSKSIGENNFENYKLIEVAKRAFDAGLKAIKPGARVNDISKAIYKVIKENNLFTPLEFSGHGIGKHLHEKPYVYNYITNNQGMLLKDNMVICIEPMIIQDSNKVKILKDGWTVVSASNKKSAHYEQTVLIKNGKGIILTEK
ncbi:type I methionyl aminopeptidase [Mesomycoplasma lagogenitalium]|uniref:Methionine aminopeptidase n=1 Tax=Mesomycoplasma lagogenitalium TaxID=171286 RepID=A0ABY8LWR7_9BACT|nr:type I methionyl aminopeptidase [Mesomycoplasma lagogenitalium]WGI36567.1 type I methionyl aminopeptidase [Mesomycoplasma lagogenitalium]